MTRGFAAIAWPAKHGNSGVMTFIVNQRDIVFQKDLGADTEQAVAAIQSFDPDDSWEPTAETLPAVEEGEAEPESERADDLGLLTGFPRHPSAHPAIRRGGRFRVPSRRTQSPVEAHLGASPAQGIRVS